MQADLEDRVKHDLRGSLFLGCVASNYNLQGNLEDVTVMDGSEGGQQRPGGLLGEKAGATANSMEAPVHWRSSKREAGCIWCHLSCNVPSC